MKTFKKNPNGIYALYQKGNEWLESASVKNKDLVNSDNYYWRGDDCYEEKLSQSLQLMPQPKQWFTAEWSVTINGVKYTLSPQKDLTPFEMYQISVWKEECQTNSNADEAFKRVHQLGIARHFMELK